MLNKKELKVQSTAKKLPKPKDIIVDPMGQWKYPGEITRIPSNEITMEGVNYPVLGIDNLGNQQMMHPGMNYTFPGQYVDEYPQFQTGGSYNPSETTNSQHPAFEDPRIKVAIIKKHAAEQEAYYQSLRKELDHIQGTQDISARQRAGKIMQILLAERPDLVKKETAGAKNAGKAILAAGKYIFPAAAPVFNAVESGVGAVEYAQNPNASNAAGTFLDAAGYATPSKAFQRAAQYAGDILTADEVIEQKAGGGSVSAEKAKAFLQNGSIYGHSLSPAQIEFFKKMLEDEGIEEDEEYKYGGGLRKHNRTTSNPAAGINDLMRRNPNYHTPKGRRFVSNNLASKKHGGSMNNDDFYLPHEEAQQLRDSTPINFVNLPYYAFGGGGGGRKVVAPNPNYVADSMATVNYAQQHPELYAFDKMKWSTNADGTSLYKQPIVNGKDGRKIPVPFGKGSKMTVEDEKAIKWHMNERAKEQGTWQYPNLFGVPPQQKMGGTPCMECGGFMEDGGSVFNYGSFPAMAKGGEFTMIINDLAKKQFGGDSAIKSTDDVIENKKNFFNAYIRENVGKAIAKELHSDMMNDFHNYMQAGGPVIDLDMQMRYGGLMKAQDGGDPYFAAHPAMDRASVNQATTQCSDQDKMTPGTSCYDPDFTPVSSNSKQPGFGYSNREGTFDTAGNMTHGPYGQNFMEMMTPITNQDLENRNAQELRQYQDQRVGQTPEVNSPFNYSFSTHRGSDVANNIIGTMDTISNMLEKRESRRRDKKIDYSGDAMFMAKSKQSHSRGDYSNGMFRPDQYVPVQYRGTPQGNIGTNLYAAQFGGGISEGDETYMSDEEIENYLAQGGDLEILD